MNHLERKPRKIHPKEKANIVTDLTFLYTFELFRKGFQKELQEDDLYEVISRYRSKRLGDELEQEWEKQKKKGQKSIIKLLVSCYGLYYFLLGLTELIVKSSILIIQPIALGQIVTYFTPNQTKLTKSDAYFYATLLIGVNFFNCLFMHNYYLRQMALGVQVRTAFCSFIYRKALKLSPAHLGNISIGKIVTLITKDAETFESFVDFANDIWSGVVRTIILSYVLYTQVGVATLAGVGFFIIVMPLQIYCGAQAKSMRLKMCQKTDERLQATQESLSAIRIIKMYTWEKIFTSKIVEARRKEINTTYKIFFLKFMVLAVGSLTTHTAFYLLLITYVWLGNAVTAGTVYFINSCFHSLSHSLSIFFPIGVYQTAELIAAVKRIGGVIKTMEVEKEENLKDVIPILPKIVLKNVTTKIKEKKILHDINLKFEKGLTIIAGPVGSGKSFLLKTILQDYSPVEGAVVVEGRISYASQEPWLFPSTIRQNIVFGEKYNEKRYQMVLKVCALLYDLEQLEQGDNTIVEDRGINLSKGQQARINLARAVYRDGEIYLLDDCLSALDGHVSEYIFKECILKFLADKLVIFVSHNRKYFKSVDNLIFLKSGKITSDNLEDEEQVRATEASEQNKISEKGNVSDEEDEADEETHLITETTTEKKVYHEEKKSGDVALDVYKKYINYGGGFIFFAMVFGVFVLSQFTISYTDKLVSVWVNLELGISNHSEVEEDFRNSSSYQEFSQKRKNIFYMYSFMTLATAATIFLRSYALFMFARRAALSLHKRMITSVIHASMRFFDNNFIGNILNRFSKDLVNVDERIPFAFYQVFRVFLMVAGTLTLIATVHPTFLVPSGVFLLLLVILRRCVLRTVRSLKRLDAATKSPMVGHLNATLEGLTTIRAFGAEEILRNEFDRHQDLYTSANYTLSCSMRAFAYTMDNICGLFIALIVGRFLVYDDGILAGSVGLALSQVTSLTGTVQWGIRQWAEIENNMTSAERVVEYGEIKQENKQGLIVEEWPKNGGVKFENVNLSYTNSNDYILKEITFAAKPADKIGIVGRTGAGKSSIIATLFRLYEAEGQIIIDGIDIKTLSLDFLRSHISLIPQDPVLFIGTVRENIDPTKVYSDDIIWKAVETVHLKGIISSLDFHVEENGSNFSSGQRQLICLARAVVRNNKIIVLDEATANMDPETDALVHNTIIETFKNCTVFTIAHKLTSVLHADKVMVLDQGRIMEYDSPVELLKNKDGRFYKMVKKAGLINNVPNVKE